MTGIHPATQWREEFDGCPAEVRRLRQWVTGLLPECPAQVDVVLIADELATNAILHTASGEGGRFAVEIAWYSGAVRVTVADDGASDGPEVISDLDADRGRGLLLVQQLCTGSGISVAGDHRGRVVSADVPWPSAVPQASSKDAVCEITKCCWSTSLSRERPSPILLALFLLLSWSGH